MGTRKNKYEKFIDELFSRIIEVNGLEKTTIGTFCTNFNNDPNSKPLSNVELNDIWSLEIADSMVIRSINIRRMNDKY
ncbi:hypothetical protein [Mucilaginibacter phyllosphaerae]|uniref:Uncharacterized protein n=1 Tax=Mucilaginibacter phyllosphaerae TaxID=1812349 RepID=A0A4Y8AMG1_9SPHI|nr:hypothetical protein [Mucilaginibacter phyllosphaerae]MBB3967437.1 hypothetical protein [Mucilaginibacter phyllosphaerae]TEW69495.1 hypothetical protein E2R65_04810 [Mucilaginibacter phyllosphaerae]GGH20699.1 hypothetical protein GCM10007352_32890 [Mucilaginibacter phyllosphaerae]